MGTNFSIIDDLVKDSYEANNAAILDNAYSWYRNTFLSREEGNDEGISIMIGTRWNSKDPIGQILESEDKDEWLEVKLKAYDEDKKEMLCENVLSYKRFKTLERELDRNIFLANYQQEPVDSEGRLYKTLLTYKEKPEFEEIIGYVDTADRGKDYLASIVAGKKDNQLYILDIYYTKDDMTITEIELSKRLHELQQKYNMPINIKIEGNNGGSNFARTIEKILSSEHKNKKVMIEWFHQSKNKYARILSNASFIQKHVFFPFNWSNTYSDFYNHLANFQRIESANEHDDGADCLTGLVEMLDDNHKVNAAISLY